MKEIEDTIKLLGSFRTTPSVNDINTIINQLLIVQHKINRQVEPKEAEARTEIINNNQK